jgi:hypothetical protein
MSNVIPFRQKTKLEKSKSASKSCENIKQEETQFSIDDDALACLQTIRSLLGDDNQTNTQTISKMLPMCKWLLTEVFVNKKDLFFRNPQTSKIEKVVLKATP